jgi:anti-anti-sigma factor
MSRPTRRKKNAAVVLEGDVTIYTAANVQQTLLTALSSGQPVTLDLGAVADFDTAGAQQVLAIARECSVLGHPLSISNASDCVREVFAMFGLDSLLPPAVAT